MTTSRCFVVAALLLIAAAARSEPFGVRLDLGPGFPLSEPQRSYFGGGFSAQLTGLYQLLPVLDLEAQVAYALLPATAASPVQGPGTVLAAGAGVRLKRPMAGNLVVPWGELGVQLAVSGGPKLALAPAAGVSFRFTDTMPLWLGLYVRVLQLFTFGGLPDVDSHHATVMSVGLAVEVFPTGARAGDQDGDGVPDDRDACPGEAGAGADGCPAPDDDPDGDGIVGVADACPGQAEDKDGFQDDDGCPDLDDDQDGVPDTRDACPREPGPAAAEGCPDRDGDGVADRVDACPDRPGKKDDGGCPTYREVVVTAKKIELKQKIHFAFGKTSILPRSDSLLAEVVQALQDRPSLCVRIEGHTDSKGSAADNLRLSAGRAQAVAEHLIRNGIEARRLQSKGYGSELPLDDNQTPEGRELNRRVEFVIVPCGE